MTILADFWKHLEALRACVFRIVVTVGAITLFMFLFDIRTASIFGVTVPYPYPDIYETISTRFFLQIKQDLLPEAVSLVALTPWAAMIIQFQISLLLGIIFGMPVIVHQVGTFLRPALKRHERRLILRLVAPASALFLLGNLFAYFLIIPFSIDFLYEYAFAMGVEQYFSVEEFFGFVVMFLVAFGVIFQLPVLMVGLSSLGIVSPDFWKEHWRWAVLASLVFAAVITPDGTGVTMMMVAVPMLLLYLVGYLLSRSRNRMLSAGLLLSGMGALAVLLAGLYPLLGRPFGQGGGPPLADAETLLLVAGIASYIAGLAVAGVSFRKPPGDRELAKR